MATKLSKLNLQINTSKTEYLSPEEDDYMIHLDGNIIEKSKNVKYLGQYIDSDSSNKTTINSAFFGKIINIMMSNKELSRQSKIKLFKIYMKSKFNHLIPLIVTSGDIIETWK